jgi:hypothetical protein
MATNKYFINYNSKYEQNLIEDLVIETIKIHGLDMYYVPRELATNGGIFGDDPTSFFSQHFVMEFYIQNVDGFEGEGDFIGKFGLEINDRATLVVSKKRFQQITDKFRPLEGDLIFFPLSKKLFEIKFVEHENPFYQLGKNYVYSLTVENFEFGEEDIRTQIPEIQEVVNKYEYGVTLEFSNLVGSFAVGQTVFSLGEGISSGSINDAVAKGEITTLGENSMKVVNNTGAWLPSTNSSDYFLLNGSGSYAKITSIDNSVDQNVFNDNDKIDDYVTEFLDFSEENPFGSPF